MLPDDRQPRYLHSTQALISKLQFNAAQVFIPFYLCKLTIAISRTTVNRGSMFVPMTASPASARAVLAVCGTQAQELSATSTTN